MSKQAYKALSSECGTEAARYIAKALGVCLAQIQLWELVK